MKTATEHGRIPTAINGASAATAGHSHAADPDPADVSRVAAIVIEVLQRSGLRSAVSATDDVSQNP